MTNVDFNLPVAFHPGEYLKMELEARNIKQKDFAEILGISGVEISMIVNGKRNITPRLAARIGEAFGTGPELWINFQTAYDLWLIRQNKEEVKVLNNIPKKLQMFYHNAPDLVAAI